MNVIVVDWCCMCKKSGKSTDHLLLHCEIAKELWSSLFNLLGVVWVMPRKVTEMLMSWRSQMGNRNALEVWRLAPLRLMWCIWREWNARSFEHQDTEMLKLKKMFQCL
jgi:hypothetical protein